MTTLPIGPLDWPHGMPRTLAGKRVRGSFQVTFDGAASSLAEEVRLLGGRAAVLAVDRPRRQRGREYEPLDPGAAIYFTLERQETALAVDRYDTARANIRALALTINAMRAIERHGGPQVMRRAFRGFAALPPPDAAPAPAEPHWSEVLGLERDAPPEAIRTRYRRLLLDVHPDKTGGSRALFDRVVAAFERARAERGIA